jgi:hypothetical protein
LETKRDKLSKSGVALADNEVPKIAHGFEKRWAKLHEMFDIGWIVLPVPVNTVLYVCGTSKIKLIKKYLLVVKKPLSYVEVPGMIQYNHNHKY